jgi:choline dehydrogenase-like flavoprotein
VEWKLSPLDKRSARHVARVLGEEMARLDHGRAYLGPWLFEDDTTWRGGHPWQGRHGWDHQMGTTRMSLDPSTGVVDTDCRVHGMNNLYVAGASVFPTYGAAPPTLTIVALALRLAAHLRGIDLTIQSSR